jgi:hypothetical protein
MSTDTTILELLNAAFERYQTNVVVADPQKAMDYMEICRKYEQAKAKQEAQGPFVKMLTPGENRLISKFESRMGNSQAYEEHKPNQNAVTYPFLLGKLMMMSGIDYESVPVEEAHEIFLDILHFISIHGQQGTTSLNRALATYDEVPGPESGMDVYPLIMSIVESPEFVTAEGASSSNKYLDNSKLSLKRIVRLIYICTEHATPWGLMTLPNDEFKANLKAMYDLENDVNSPDMNSLSMIWYLCIERGNICAIMVDHHEKSASNQLCRFLGNTQQSRLLKPTHVFPFDVGEDHVFGI